MRVVTVSCQTVLMSGETHSGKGFGPTAPGGPGAYRTEVFNRVFPIGQLCMLGRHHVGQACVPTRVCDVCVCVCVSIGVTPQPCVWRLTSGSSAEALSVCSLWASCQVHSL